MVFAKIISGRKQACKSYKRNRAELREAFTTVCQLPRLRDTGFCKERIFARFIEPTLNITCTGVSAR